MDFDLISIIKYFATGAVASFALIKYIIVCIRSKSLLPGLRHLVNKTIGNQEYHSELLAASDKKIQDINRFAYLHGINYTSHKKLMNFRKREEKYDLFIPSIAKSGLYFKPTLNKIVIRKDIYFKASIVFLALLGLLSCLFALCFGDNFSRLNAENHYLASEGHSYLLVNSDEVIASDIYFWKSKPSMKDWRMKLDKCNVNELSEKAQITARFAQQICDIPSSNDLIQRVDYGIRWQQHYVWFIAGLVTTIWIFSLSTFIFALKKLIYAHTIRKYLYRCYKGY